MEESIFSTHGESCGCDSGLCIRRKREAVECSSMACARMVLDLTIGRVI